MKSLIIFLTDDEVKDDNKTISSFKKAVEEINSIQFLCKFMFNDGSLLNFQTKETLDYLKIDTDFLIIIVDYPFYSLNKNLQEKIDIILKNNLKTCFLVINKNRNILSDEIKKMDEGKIVKSIRIIEPKPYDEKTSLSHHFKSYLMCYLSLWATFNK